MQISLLDALVSDGPLKGWPLGAALAISEGNISPTEAKECMVAEYERRKVETVEQFDKAIEAVRALPPIVLS